MNGTWGARLLQRLRVSATVANALMAPPAPSLLATSALAWRDGSGRLRITAVVKTRFQFGADGSAHVVAAEPVFSAISTGVASNQTADIADLVPLKVYTDVLIAGRAPVEPADQKQAVGFAIARGADVLLQRVLVRSGPTLVEPDSPATEAHFGPVSPAAEPRLSWAPPPEALQARPIFLPTRLDLRFFQSAPPSQWTTALHGNERILVVGLAAAGASKVLRLPGLHAFARLTGPGVHNRPVALAADTLVIDPVGLIAEASFRGSVEIERRFAAAAAEQDAYTIAAGLAPVENIEASFASPPAWSFFFNKPVPTQPSPVVDPIQIENDSGLAAVTMAWSPDPKSHRRAVIVKGTFEIRPNGAPVALSEKQELPHGDVFSSDGENAALDLASDFVPMKLRADVLLRGTAHAPPGEHAALVSLFLGALRARIVALPPRTFGSDGVPRPSGPFAPVPLRFENAFGGPGFAQNPVGTGFAPGSSPPLLEDPDRLMRTRADRPKPAVMGPISPLWESRKNLLGSFDAAWQRDRWPCFPANFDAAHFNAAPAELRCPYLKGDEPFRIDNVLPGGHSISGALPGVRPRAFVVRENEPIREVSLQLDTVLFDTDAMQLKLTWRGSFASADQSARLIIVQESVHTPRSAEHISTLLCARAARGFAAPVAKLPAPRSTELGEVLKIASKPVKLDKLVYPLAVSAGALVFAAGAKAAAAPRPKAPAPLSKQTLVEQISSGKSLQKADLTGVDLSELDLSGQNLSGAILQGADLTGVNLAKANLTGAQMAGIRAARANFSESNLTLADLSGADLQKADLSGADLTKTKLTQANMSGSLLQGSTGENPVFVKAQLTHVNASNVRFSKADFSYAAAVGIVFHKADLTEAKFLETTASKAIFEEAVLSDARFEKTDIQGGNFSSATAKGTVFEQCNLTSALLKKADLTGSVFAGSNLSKADLRGVLARSAHFKSALLDEAKFDGADLMQASLESASLKKTTFVGANLYQAETWKASAEQADFSGALLTGTKLAPRK
ncbi:MAG: DUF2169 domain-containing protein [Polyangiaceae bacterium]|nr:DUF2169 domain-containing protein [Polyangiaceae bacterium]